MREAIPGDQHDPRVRGEVFLGEKFVAVVLMGSDDASEWNAKLFQDRNCLLPFSDGVTLAASRIHEDEQGFCRTRCGLLLNGVRF